MRIAGHALLALVLASLACLPARAEPGRLAVSLDHAQIARVPSGTATIVVGNPLIADATVQRNGVLVVTGRSYGSTNILALDGEGATIAEIGVDVQAAGENTVTLYRGLARHTLSCAPWCQPTLRLGDSSEAFGTLADEIGKRNGLSTQTGGGSGGN